MELVALILSGVSIYLSLLCINQGVFIVKKLKHLCTILGINYENLGE